MVAAAEIFVRIAVVYMIVNVRRSYDVRLGNDVVAVFSGAIVSVIIPHPSAVDSRPERFLRMMVCGNLNKGLLRERAVIGSGNQRIVLKQAAAVVEVLRFDEQEL